LSSPTGTHVSWLVDPDQQARGPTGKNHAWQGRVNHSPRSAGTCRKRASLWISASLIGTHV
jgi:hypothetical protein